MKLFHLFKNLIDSAFKDLAWPPFLIAPLAILFTYLAHRQGWNAGLEKAHLESLALLLTGGSLIAYLWRAKRDPSPLVWIMIAFSFSFFCREIHFAGTSDGVYIALLAIVIWSWKWRKKLREPFQRGKFKTWLFAMGWTYFLAIFIQRRALKHLVPIPEFLELEHAIHVPVEEVLENVAHLLLFITAFCGLKQKK